MFQKCLSGAVQALAADFGTDKLKNIERIQLSRFEIEVWYHSPLPEEFSGAGLEDGKLYMCEFCLRYFRKSRSFDRHVRKCEARFPPGVEIYREPPPPSSPATAVTTSVFEVDGSEQKVYCQNLSLLAKMFLDHKTVFYDVEPFMFYVVTGQSQTLLVS